MPDRRGSVGGEPMAAIAAALKSVGHVDHPNMCADHNQLY